MPRPIPEFTSEGVNQELIFQFKKQFKQLEFKGIKDEIIKLDPEGDCFFNKFPLKGEGEYSINGECSIYIKALDNSWQSQKYFISGKIIIKQEWNGINDDKIKIEEGKCKDQIQEKKVTPKIDFLYPLFLKKKF